MGTGCLCLSFREEVTFLGGKKVTRRRNSGLPESLFKKLILFVNRRLVLSINQQTIAGEDWAGVWNFMIVYS